MARLFLRRVNVFVGGANLNISDLMVSFHITRKADQKPAEGEISIYNLNESHETLIRDRGDSVHLEAGYIGARYGMLVSGDIRDTDKERNGLDRIIRIQVGGQVKKRAEAFVSLAYEGEIPIRTIIADTVAQGFPQLVLGDMALVPAAAIEEDFVYSGQGSTVLTGLLAPYEVLWYEDNGIIRFTRQGMSNDDRGGSGGGVLSVSERTGMVGSPRTTTDGIVVTTLLDHRIGLDTRMQVKSEILSFAAGGDAANARAIETSSGVWKVITVSHTGDNRDGSYFTECELRPL